MPKVIRSAGAALASVDVIETRGPGWPVGTLALPVRDHINAATMASLLTTDYSWLGGRSLDRVTVQGSVLTLQRNEAVQRMRGDWLLFIDDDMTWPADALARLVASYEELREAVAGPVMLGGLCVRRVVPHQPTMYMREQPTSGQYNFLEEWTEDVVEVDATGMAFVIIGVPVFEAIMGGPMPPLDVRAELLPWLFFDWTGHVGEDIGFCAKAKAAGARIFVDTRIAIGHVGEVNFGIEHFWQQVAQRDSATEERRRGINDAWGLPTMTAEQARTRLGW